MERKKLVVPIIAGAAAVLAIAVLVIALTGGSIVGVWEPVELREYVNGQLDLSHNIAPGGHFLEFHADGRFVATEGEMVAEGTWESLGAGRLIITTLGGALSEELSYSVNRRELRLTESEMWQENYWEDVMVLRRIN